MENMMFSAWPAEQRVIADLIAGCPGEYVIEIGCYRGNTTKVMAEAASRCGKKVVCIDPWDGSTDNSDEATYQIFLGNTSPWKDIITVIRKESHVCGPGIEFMKGKVAVAFIDGNHFYPHPYADMLNCWSLLTMNGSMVIHDVFDDWHSRHIKICLDDFLMHYGHGLSVNFQKYIPTHEELNNTRHGISGLAWIFKP